MNQIRPEELSMLLQLIHTFGEKEVTPVVPELDELGEFPEELYQKAYALGLHMLDIPREYGGAGLGAYDACRCYEELGRYDAGLSTGLGAGGLAFKVLKVAGTEAQKQLFADRIRSGGLGAFCLTEPEAGSDSSNVKTRAVRDGDEYVINGVKSFITSGGVANVYTLFASTDPSRGVKGLSAFVVERDRPGISVGKHENKMGIRLSNTCDVIFEDVRIPASHLVGKEGAGFAIAMKTLDLARPTAAAGALGICQAAMDISVKYAKERIAFGKPIAALQAIQFMLADMEIATQTARQYVYHACRLIDDGKPHSMESAIAKCVAGDTAMKVATDAVQVLGGYGYMRDYPAEKLMRDAKIFQIFEGTNQIQRVVVAGQLLR